MIFGSFGLLVVALALLIAAIVKSSVAIGIASLVCTALAIGCLAAANAYYRRAHATSTKLGHSPLSSVTPAGASAMTPTMVMMPQMAMAGAPLNGHAAGGPSLADAPPIENFDALDAPHAAASVALLNLDQLHLLRRYEVEHAARKTVLAAIDERVSALVALRRSLQD